MSYSLKLRDPRWKKKSLEILQRDGWRCIFCKSNDKPLNVRHGIFGRRDPWDYPDYVYQSLCEDCHSIRQELTDKAVDALRIAMLNIPTEQLTGCAQTLCAAAMLAIPEQKEGA